MGIPNFSLGYPKTCHGCPKAIMWASQTSTGVSQTPTLDIPIATVGIPNFSPGCPKIYLISKLHNQNFTIVLCNLLVLISWVLKVKQPVALDTDITLTICPSRECFETIPAMVSNTLRATIRKRKALIDANGPDASGVSHLELEICLQITNEHEKEILRCRAIANEWPTVIDFSSLPNRIAKADPQNELTGLLFISIEVETNDIFCNLIDDLIELGLGKTIADVISTQDNCREGMAWIFTHFILIPHIARHLIAEDLDVTLMEAFEEMAASGKVGKYLQELDDTRDDEVLDNITMNTVVDQKDGRWLGPRGPIGESKMLQHLALLALGATNQGPNRDW
ncbi:hypothetical protein BU15DRAFT_68621 [Melanogaster broomeanus]|nr:hypothetical protein BU15DRAFT_68621 [Melanogaster broomeanus]